MPPANQDFPLMLCRMWFVAWLVVTNAIWFQLSGDDRVYAAIIAVGGAVALGRAATFHAFCSMLEFFGWIIILFSLFPLITGYRTGYYTIRVVERTTGITPLISGTSLVLVAFIAKRRWRI